MIALSLHYTKFSFVEENLKILKRNEQGFLKLGKITAVTNQMQSSEAIV